MVIVQCYHCSKILELDEGFRGGVCRCSECGSLLQVPKAAGSGSQTERARPATPGGGRPANPNEARKPEGDPRSGIGSGMRPQSPQSPPQQQQPMDAIEAIATATGSGGFSPSPVRPAGPPRVEKVTPIDHMGPSGTGMSGMANAASRARHIKQNRTTLFVFLALGGVIVIAGVAVVIAIANSGGKDKKGDTGSATQEAINEDMGEKFRPIPKTPPQSKVPAVGYFGVKLTGKKIVLSMDSGGSMSELFDYTKTGALKATENLDSGQTFKVAVWQSPLKTIPGAWAKKGDKNIAKELDNIYSSMAGQDEVKNIVDSVKLGGDQTVIISAKLDFGSSLPAEVAKVRKPNQKIDVIWITGGGSDDSSLKKIADSSGGTFTTIPADKIKSFYGN